MQAVTAQRIQTDRPKPISSVSTRTDTAILRESKGLVSSVVEDYGQFVRVLMGPTFRSFELLNGHFEVGIMISTGSGALDPPLKL